MSGEALFDGGDLSLPERDILKAIKTAQDFGLPMPSVADLARLLGVKHTAHIPALVRSVFRKGYLFRNRLTRESTGRFLKLPPILLSVQSTVGYDRREIALRTVRIERLASGREVHHVEAAT